MPKSRNADRHQGRKADRQKSRKTETAGKCKAQRHKDVKAGKQKSRKAEKQKGRKAEKQENRKAEMHVEVGYGPKGKVKPSKAKQSKAEQSKAKQIVGETKGSGWKGVDIVPRQCSRTKPIHAWRVKEKQSIFTIFERACDYIRPFCSLGEELTLTNLAVSWTEAFATKFLPPRNLFERLRKFRGQPPFPTYLDDASCTNDDRPRAAVG